MLGLIVTAPLFAVLAVAVRLTSPGPALFRQTRVGRNEVTFQIIKLRTMVADRPGAGSLVSGRADPRITGLGAWLRRTRLDELPQLANLLRGDVTLVGPRPEVPRYVAAYSARERAALRVRPGIIGAGALQFAARYAGELDAAADPEREYVTRVLPALVAHDLDHLAHRGARHDAALVWSALKVCARHG